MNTYVKDLVIRDFNFIKIVYNKVNITPPSWYWREISESEDEWINRRVNLSNGRNMVEGHLLYKNTYIYYKIPLGSSLSIVQIGQDLNMKEILVPYNELYDTLEHLFLLNTVYRPVS
jgi:hypothetical protein